MMTCHGDALCRCRTCKPPLPARPAPSARLAIGAAGLALLVFAATVWHATGL